MATVDVADAQSYRDLKSHRHELLRRMVVSSEVCVSVGRIKVFCFDAHYMNSESRASIHVL